MARLSMIAPLVIAAFLTVLYIRSTAAGTKTAAQAALNARVPASAR